MPSVLPEGEPTPDTGSLPEDALAGVGGQPFGVYVHVPFCVTRCGYCDFNTYTATELGSGASRETYAGTAAQEVRLAGGVLADSGDGARTPPVSTVFFGGGTPTLLPPDDLARIVAEVDTRFGLASDAEVTAEANPESVDPVSLARLREAGFTRVSFGMQSAREHVLAILERRHTPGRPQQAVAEAHAAGFEHVSLDLIYGTPGETDDDWRASLDAAVGARPDHISAYSLIVEDGTRLAARVRRGELAAPDENALADRYLMAEERLAAAGYEWYEVSNWARSPEARCRHNLLYWTSGNWWGVGPGAHSHMNGVRWWNVKHPAAYASRLAEGRSPGQGREVLGGSERHLERVLLSVRLASGCSLDELTDAGRAAARQAVEDGLLQPDAYERGRGVLTLRGRLLADAVVRDLTD